MITVRSARINCSNSMIKFVYVAHAMCRCLCDLGLKDSPGESPSKVCICFVKCFCFFQAPLLVVPIFDVMLGLVASTAPSACICWFCLLPSYLQYPTAEYSTTKLKQYKQFHIQCVQAFRDVFSEYQSWRIWLGRLMC
jgi:hypothetical protein